MSAAVVGGIWVTGGLITDDFRVAMGLTFAWMVLAALLCGAIAWRSPQLRAPVLGAYLVTAAVACAYLGRSTLFEDRVDERVAVAPEPAPGARTDPAARPPLQPANLLLSRGSFESLAHPARGRAGAIRLSGGRRVLALSPFEVDNGPDLRVYLVAGSPRGSAGVRDFVDLGALKGNSGAQQYAIPRRVDLERYGTVVIWCRAFSVAFARAQLRSAR